MIVDQISFREHVRYYLDFGVVKMKKFLTAGIFVLINFAGISTASAQEGQKVPPPPDQSSRPDVVTVRVKGLGVDQKDALNDALRKAIERGGHLEVFAQSQTENYTLIHDTVLAQATGLIRDYQICREGDNPIGGYFVEIEARVDRKIIDATWGQVQILLQQMGRPKILVNFVEKINDLALQNGEVVETESLLANKIEQLLVEKGFEIVDSRQIENLKQNRLKEAALNQDQPMLKQLAGELGAQMYIVGVARASGPQTTDAYGVPLYMWETDVTLKAFWSETGQILFAKSDIGTRSGSRTPGPPGAKKAIEKAGEKLAYQCLQAILEKWSRQTVGGGKIVLEVKGVDFKRMLMIQDALKQIQDVRDVSREFNKPTAKFELTTPIAAEKFAEILCDIQWPDFALEIENQKFNTIYAMVVMCKQRTDTPDASSQKEQEQTTQKVTEKQADHPTAQPAKTSIPASAASTTSTPTTNAATSQSAGTQPATQPTQNIEM